MKTFMTGVCLMAAVASAAPAMARDLPVPADKGWKHAQSGVILRAQLAGMTRIGLSDATNGEFDVTAQFATPDKATFATIYLFQPAVQSVPMWFDRARTALEERDIFRNAAPATIDPIAFAAPGATTASSLRQVYALASGRPRSTALAVIPVGQWLVAIRLTSDTLVAEQLDATLSTLITAIAWPAASGAAVPAAVPIAPCSTPLAYGKAKVVKTQGADALVSLLLTAGLATAEARKKPDTPADAPPVWCRGDVAGARYAAYRSSDDAASYVMALGDAGRVITVAPSLMGQVDKKGIYTVTLKDVDGNTAIFATFSALPAPDQVLKAVMNGKPAGRAKAGNITLDSGAF